MRVPISRELSLEDLKTKLEAEIPNVICQWRGKKMLLVNEQGTTAAAYVQARKKNAVINPAFATMGSQLIFSFSLLAFGIMIPYLVYYLTFQKKQKAICEKVVHVVKGSWGA